MVTRIAACNPLTQTRHGRLSARRVLADLATRLIELPPCARLTPVSRARSLLLTSATNGRGFIGGGGAQG